MDVRWGSPYDLSSQARKAAAKAARRRQPRRTHADWKPAADRPDPVDVLELQAETREKDLVPIRYGRMLSSPFAFYRAGPYADVNDRDYKRLAAAVDAGRIKATTKALSPREVHSSRRKLT
jgi:hypothetical protein